MARKTNDDGEITIGKSAPAWMLTYSDLMTQILIFFVLFLTLSSLEAKQSRQIIVPIKGGIGINEQKVINKIVNPILNEPQLMKVQEQIALYAKEKNIAKEVKLRLDERGLIISFAEKSMFRMGDAEILPEARTHLDVVAKTLKNLPNSIRVEGHTCNIPIHTSQFPSNWELSVIRATNVARYLVERDGFSPKKIAAAGYGEFQPLVMNDTEDHRAENRRVDLVILWQRHQPLL